MTTLKNIVESAKANILKISELCEEKVNLNYNDNEDEIGRIDRQQDMVQSAYHSDLRAIVKYFQNTEPIYATGKPDSIWLTLHYGGFVYDVMTVEFDNNSSKIYELTNLNSDDFDIEIMDTIAEMPGTIKTEISIDEFVSIIQSRIVPLKQTMPFTQFETEALADGLPENEIKTEYNAYLDRIQKSKNN